MLYSSQEHGIHDSYSHPPNVPPFTERDGPKSGKKKAKTDQSQELISALTTIAESVATAFKPPNVPVGQAGTSTTTVSIIHA